jgi:hypothetical protein
MPRYAGGQTSAHQIELVDRMMFTPKPRKNRPATNCGTPCESADTNVLATTITHPMNVPHFLPNISQAGPLNGKEHIPPTVYMAEI